MTCTAANSGAVQHVAAIGLARDSYQLADKVVNLPAGRSSDRDHPHQANVRMQRTTSTVSLKAGPVRDVKGAGHAKVVVVAQPDLVDRYLLLVCWLHTGLLGVERLASPRA